MFHNIIIILVLNTANKLAMDMHIVYGNNQIAKSTNTKFTGFIMYPYLTRNNYLFFIFSFCYDLLYNFVKLFSP
jgi:hypothetical protein